MKERGCTLAEVQHTLKLGIRAPAKYNRVRFVHTFAYNRKWLGKSYHHKTVEAFATERGMNDWLVITVIVKYF